MNFDSSQARPLTDVNRMVFLGEPLTRPMDVNDVEGFDFVFTSEQVGVPTELVAVRMFPALR